MMPPMARRLILSVSLETRMAAAEDWLGRRAPAEQLLVVADNASGLGTPDSPNNDRFNIPDATDRGQVSRRQAATYRSA